MAPRIDKTNSVMDRRAGAARRAEAFSLVELLVIIAIISLLLGIGVAVGAGVRSRAKVSQARGLLGRCQLIAGEYQISTGNIVNGNGIATFILGAKTNPRTYSMLKDLGQGVYFDGSNEIRDPWGNDLDYYSFFNANGAGPLIDHPTPFFVSWGPDGNKGDVAAADGTPDKQASIDNLYSYEMK